MLDTRSTLDPRPRQPPPWPRGLTAAVRPDREYQLCTRCVMDTSDPEIAFDSQGVCSHCRAADELFASIPPLEQRTGELERLVARMKADGAGKPYDCVIGVSGGIDSTFVAWKTRDLGLRPLAVHLDNGWDSELAVANIEKVLKRLEIDLFTVVLDWDEFRGLQVAFLRASTSDSEVPSDHAIFASLYRVAARHGIRHIISGTNRSTESILPGSWTYGIGDWRYIKAVNRLLGAGPLRTFPHLSLRRRWWCQWVRRMKVVGLLDYLDYDKAAAMDLLQNQLGWKYYGGKHHESIYTRFFQSYILPRKFNIDKRRAHLSSLICAGQTTREAALAELETPICPHELLEEDRLYTIKKLGLSEAEFEAIMALPIKTHRDYPTSIWVRSVARRAAANPTLRSMYRRLKRRGLVPDRWM